MFAIALLALSGIANALTMNTPCQPIKLTWEAGVPPFYLAVVPGGQTSAAPLVNFPTTDAMSQTWMVSLAAGTSVTIMVTDGTGEMSVTSPVTVMAGSNTDCMNASSSEVPASTPAPSGEQTPASTPGPSAILSVPASSPGAPAPVSPSAAVSSASTTVSSVSRPASSSSAVVSPSASPTSGAGRVAVGGAVAAAAGLVALAAF